jgi:acyl-CoA reductase-like NAD-dependent aldehyde dehydrogenase
LSPTVLTDVPEASSLWAREAFGPVAGINAYSTLEEAVDSVNRSDYGLQAGIFTKDIEAAFYAARECQVGGFLINDVPQFRVDHMPYGGVKLSGAGREGPRYAVEEMTEPKLITWRV